MSSSCSTVVTNNYTDLVLEPDIDTHVRYLDSTEKKRQDDRILRHVQKKHTYVVVQCYHSELFKQSRSNNSSVFYPSILMATEDPNDIPPADQETNDQENYDVNPPAAKIQKVLAVEEVRETVATAVKKEALKKFSTSSGSK